MKQRALWEVMKYLPLDEVLLRAVQVSSEWQRAVHAEETLLFFLNRDGEDSDPALPLYERLKHQQLNRTPNYLLHVADCKACVWRVSDLSGQSVREVQDPAFVNSARYALISPKVAIVTGGVEEARRCSSINLITLSVTRLSDMLEDRSWHGIASLKGQVYISGGEDGITYLSSAEVFDGKEWRKIADMTRPRHNLTLSVFRTRIYAFGGYDGQCLSSIEYFDGSAWHLAELLLPSPRNYPSVIDYKKNLLLVGGFEVNTQIRAVHVWEGDSWRMAQALEADFSLSNAVTIKQEKCYLYDHRLGCVQFQVSM